MRHSDVETTELLGELPGIIWYCLFGKFKFEPRLPLEWLEPVLVCMKGTDEDGRRLLRSTDELPLTVNGVERRFSSCKLLAVVIDDLFLA